MPTVLRVGGHRFFFFSNEGDEPPHIHVETAGSLAKFWLAPVALASARGYTARDLRQLARLVDEHRALFEAKWHEYFN